MKEWGICIQPTIPIYAHYCFMPETSRCDVYGLPIYFRKVVIVHSKNSSSIVAVHIVLGS